MDRMTSMATFVKVVESGGFSAAARALSMSPSMVTAHVQSLEERLGVRLLNRSTRRVSLTEVGHAYYERCLQILADVEDADQIAESLQSTPRGTLRLNTSIAIPPLLAPVVAEFVALYPEVSVNLTMTDRMIDLVEEGFDLAVRNMSVPDSSLIVRRVATYRFVVCGAPSYLAARGTPGQPADLVQHNCLIYSQSAWGNEWRFVGPDGEQSITVAGNLQANSDNALRLAVVHGQGSQLHRRAGEAFPRRSCVGGSVPFACRAEAGYGSRRECTIPERAWRRRRISSRRVCRGLFHPLRLSLDRFPNDGETALACRPVERRRARAAGHGAGANRHRGREPLLSAADRAAGARARGRLARRARTRIRRAGARSRHRVPAFRAVSVEDGARQCSLRIGTHGTCARGPREAGEILHRPGRAHRLRGQLSVAAFGRHAPAHRDCAHARLRPEDPADG